VIDRIGRTSHATICDQYEARIVELDGRKKVLQEELVVDGRELQAAEKGLGSFKRWKTGLSSLCKGLAEGNVDLRLRLRAHLRELVERIEVFTVRHNEVYVSDKEPNDVTTPKQKAEGTKGKRPPVVWRRRPQHDGDDIADYLYDVVGEVDPKLVRTKVFHAFVEEVVKRRMS
jgi:hypothetical protein